MEPYEGPLKAAIDLRGSANREFGKEPPRTVFNNAHGAIHSFVEAISKFEGARGKIRHGEVGKVARELGLPPDLADAITAVEEKRGIVYGAVVTEEDARSALETANRLARVAERKIRRRAPFRRSPSRPARSI